VYDRFNPLPQGKMRIRTLASALLPLLALPLAGNRAVGEDLPMGEHRFVFGERLVSGYYTISWEQQSFSPCVAGEARGPRMGGTGWWVTNPGPVAASYRDLVENEYGTIFITVRADVTDEGMFGHMGMYRRAVAFRELLQAKRAEPDDCERVTADSTRAVRTD
jgi:hypothetical protein